MLSGLEVSGLEEDSFIQLSDVFTQKGIPVPAEIVPSNQDIARWPYLQKVSIPEIHSKVEMPIGINASKIIEPWEIVTSQGEGPYATKTMVG